MKNIYIITGYACIVLKVFMPDTEMISIALACFILARIDILEQKLKK